MLSNGMDHMLTVLKQEKEAKEAAAKAVKKNVSH